MEKGRETWDETGFVLQEKSYNYTQRLFTSINVYASSNKLYNMMTLKSL
jgi:hypothetical protein